MSKTVKTMLYLEDLEKVNTTQMEVSCKGNSVHVPQIITELLEIKQGDIFYCYMEEDTIKYSTVYPEENVTLHYKPLKFKSNRTFLIPKEFRTHLNLFQLYMHIEKGVIYVTSNKIWGNVN